MAYEPKIVKPIKPRKQYTYDFPNGNNGGMNCAVPADRVRQDQSPDMLNMCYDNGTLTQRKGFNTAKTMLGDGAIRGMFTCMNDNGDKEMLIIADGKVYREVLENV